MQIDEPLAGRYRLESPLGRGGMGEVFAGYDERLERDVAVKLLLPAFAEQEDVRRRFSAEARAAAALVHPHVVAVFDTGIHERTPFIVMERLPGGTLADRLLEGPLEEGAAVTMASQLLAALRAAHRLGLVHRDVKPANLLLARDGAWKVGDFGIAKAGGEELTRTGELLGTPAYLAPERIEGEEATPRSDLFSVGVVLYEALAGRRPFTADTPMAVLYAVQRGVFVPLDEHRSDLTPGLVDAVGRALRAAPEERFASADEMAAALASPALRGSPTLILGPEPEAAGSDPTPAGRRWRRSAPLLAALGALLLLLALASALPDSPSESGQSPPASLDDALDRLEAAVTP